MRGAGIDRKCMCMVDMLISNESVVDPFRGCIVTSASFSSSKN